MKNNSISKILVPVDFSHRAEGAVRRAHRLANRFGSEIVLVHVLEPIHVDFAMVEPFELPLRELAQAHRAKKESELNGFAAQMLRGVKVTRVIAEGDPATEILACGRQQKADLVVMPTQGHGRLRSLLIGSVTAKVLDQSELPVLTGTHLAPEGDASDWQVHRILCAVDLGARSEHVMRWGAAVAAEFQAEATVLHVANTSSAAAELAAAAARAGLEAECLVAGGEPDKVVSATAAKIRANLVIIGRGTATDTLGRLRAQAYSIVRQAPCPVLSV